MAYHYIFSELQDQIRGILIRSDKLMHLHDDNWWNLVSSLDLLHDTDLAISHFLETKWKEGDHGEMYLKIYGFFTSLYLQHEAVDALYLTSL
jgi:hypothetical protein